MNHLLRTLATFAVLAGAGPASLAGATVHHAPPRASGDAAFVAKADDACAAAGAKITKLPKVTSKNLVSEVRQQTAIGTELIAKLKAIKAPSAEAAKYKSFIAATQKSVTALRAAIKDLEQGKAKEADAQLKRVTAAGKRSDRLASGLGLPACAKDYEAKG
jgi:hypothetical protein